jgi:hypothetical protein
MVVLKFGGGFGGEVVSEKGEGRRIRDDCGDPGLPPGIPVMHTIHDPRRPS